MEFPFAAGVTLDKLEIQTSQETGVQPNKHSFHKQVVMSSLAVYWQPRVPNIYSDNTYQEDGVKDIQFRSKVARNEAGCKGLKYLLGPIRWGPRRRHP